MPRQFEIPPILSSSALITAASRYTYASVPVSPQYSKNPIPWNHPEQETNVCYHYVSASHQRDEACSGMRIKWYWVLEEETHLPWNNEFYIGPVSWWSPSRRCPASNFLVFLDGDDHPYETVVVRLCYPGNIHLTYRMSLIVSLIQKLVAHKLKRSTPLLSVSERLAYSLM